MPLLNYNVVGVRLQAMRAVGNLCIDHGKGMHSDIVVFVIWCVYMMMNNGWLNCISDHNREVVLSTGGCPLLIDQLSRCLDNTGEDGQSDRIKCVTCGCILNIANDNGQCNFAL